jgi:hypothetical protein
VIILRNRPEFAPGSAISTLALFTVTRIGKHEARFDLEHHRFSKHMPRAQIIDALCRSLPPGAELLTRLPHVHEPAVRRAQLTSQPLPPTDFELIRRNLPQTTICPLSVTDEHLVTAGEELGLEMAGPNSSSLSRGRRAPGQAMALWAIYVSGYYRKPAARVMFAAFRAWRALEDARPIPF